MEKRIRWASKLFKKGGHLTVFGASVFRDTDAAPRTQKLMQGHVASCRKCATLVSSITRMISVARTVLFGRWRVSDLKASPPDPSPGA